MIKAKKLASIGKNCVACGSCIGVCPLKAISIDDGISAKVDTNKCVGCAKCAKVCPASIIKIVVSEVPCEK